MSNKPATARLVQSAPTTEGFQVDGRPKEETKEKQTGAIELCVISPPASSRPAGGDLMRVLLAA